MKKILLMLIITISVINVSVAQEQRQESFLEWVDILKNKALDEGVSANVIGKSFANVYLDEKIINFDRSQPEVKRTFEEYLKLVVNNTRIKQGQKFYLENIKSLNEVSEKYGVPAEYITALLGVETNYGERFGNHSIINSLTTLSYDVRRSKFFTKELMTALKIIDEGHVDLENMRGSWAGAMGQSQFMPSSFMSYAVDYNQDGKKDIWHSKTDVFASAANYLHNYKFNANQKWGRRVKLPKDFSEDLLGLDNKQSVQEWESLGVRNKNGLELPTSGMQGSIIAPDGITGPAYLVYDNFRVFLRWNRSYHFATSVGLLADAIRDGK